LMQALGVPGRFGGRAVRYETIAVLVEMGADVNRPNDAGFAPVSRAVVRRMERAVPSLLEAGATVGIIEAVLLGDGTRVEQLLAEDPKLANAELSNWTTPLMLAAYACEVGIAERLIGYDAFIDAQDRAGNSPVHYAILYGRECRTEILALLLESQADPNLVALDREDTPLHLASEYGQVESVRLLLGAGAEVETLNEEGHSPLMLAAMRRGSAAAETAGALIASGADPNATSPRGSTAIMFARDPMTVKVLLENGAEIATEGRAAAEHLTRVMSPFRGSTANEAGIIRLLLEYGLSADAEVDGQPALIRAVQYRRTATVEVLLEYGADPTASDSSGRTPLELAERNAAGDIVELLNTAIAERASAAEMPN